MPRDGRCLPKQKPLIFSLKVYINQLGVLVSNGLLNYMLLLGLSHFVAASYTEDSYGVVQKDLPAILSMILDFQGVFEYSNLFLFTSFNIYSFSSFMCACVWIICSQLSCVDHLVEYCKSAQRLWRIHRKMSSWNRHWNGPLNHPFTDSSSNFNAT